MLCHHVKVYVIFTCFKSCRRHRTCMSLSTLTTFLFCWIVSSFIVKSCDDVIFCEWILANLLDRKLTKCTLCYTSLPVTLLWLLVAFFVCHWRFTQESTLQYFKFIFLSISHVHVIVQLIQLQRTSSSKAIKMLNCSFFGNRKCKSWHLYLEWMVILEVILFCVMQRVRIKSVDEQHHFLDPRLCSGSKNWIRKIDSRTDSRDGWSGKKLFFKKQPYSRQHEGGQIRQAKKSNRR